MVDSASWTNLNISRRYGQDIIFGSTTHHNDLYFRSLMPSGGTGFFRRGVSSMASPSGYVYFRSNRHSEISCWLMWCSVVVVGGALPLLFVGYTAAPFVNYIHLALPAFARKSREQALQYAKNLPPYATIYINTMKFSTIPRRVEVRISDLIPDKSILRPVSFRNINPARLPWWQGRAQAHFFTTEKSNLGRSSMAFYPELWEPVYQKIQQNQQSKVVAGRVMSKKSWNI